MNNHLPILADVEDDPRRPWKAVASTVSTFIGLFVATWIADQDPFTLKEAGSAALGAGIGSGIIGGVTFSVPNPKKIKNRSK